MTDVVFPPLSKDAPETVGVLSTWFVHDGDDVTADQVLAEAQVDKVAADVVAPAAGRIHLLVDEDAEVSPGSLIATITDSWTGAG